MLAVATAQAQQATPPPTDTVSLDDKTLVMSIGSPAHLDVQQVTIIHTGGGTAKACSACSPTCDYVGRPGSGSYLQYYRRLNSSSVSIPIEVCRSGAVGKTFRLAWSGNVWTRSHPRNSGQQGYAEVRFPFGTASNCQNSFLTTRQNNNVMFVEGASHCHTDITITN